MLTEASGALVPMATMVIRMMTSGGIQIDPRQGAKSL